MGGHNNNIRLLLARDLNDDPIHDPFSSHKIHNQDVNGVVNYYGYLSIDGSWNIMKESDFDANGTAQTYRYCVGASTYATAWTNRASLIYDYINNIIVYL